LKEKFEKIYRFSIQCLLSPKNGGKFPTLREVSLTRSQHQNPLKARKATPPGLFHLGKKQLFGDQTMMSRMRGRSFPLVLLLALVTAMLPPFAAAGVSYSQADSIFDQHFDLQPFADSADLVYAVAPDVLELVTNQGSGVLLVALPAVRQQHVDRVMRWHSLQKRLTSPGIRL
jgi:hypothetical protein